MFFLVLLCGCVGKTQVAQEADVCAEIEETEWMDACYIRQATEMRDPSICEKVTLAENKQHCLRRADFLHEEPTTTVTTSTIVSRPPVTVAPRPTATTATVPATVTTTLAPTTTTQQGPPVKLTFFDVGFGDATLLQTDKTTVLTDCGSSNTKIKRLLDEAGVTEIDYLIVSQPTIEDYDSCYSVMKDYLVKNVIESGVEARIDKREFIRYRGHANMKNLRFMSEGDRIEFDGLEVEIIHPKETRPRDPIVKSSALVYRLTYGETTVLMTGDCNMACMEAITGDVSAKILKVPDSGSRDSAQTGFIERVGPEVAVITQGPSKRDFPHKDTVKALNAQGATVLLTDDLGSVTLKLTPSSYEVLD